MKTIFIFVAGSIAPGILNQIAAHPQIIDVALGILLGVLFGLLCACVFVGPTPKNTKKSIVVAKKYQKIDCQPRKIIEQPVKTQYGLSIFNYQPTEWGIA